MTDGRETFALVTTARNEGPYFLEWVAWHRLVGFDTIIVYQNDSDDFTHETLSTLEAIGAIRYVVNQAAPGRHQVSAYKRASRLPDYAAADWIMALDMDEFLLVHAGDGTVRALLSALPPVDRVFINWRRFGHGGHEHLGHGLVTERFVTAQPCLAETGHLEAYKTLFRNAAFTRPGIHQPRGPREGRDPLPDVNGSGLGEGGYLRHNFRCTDPGGWRLAQVNHYITRDIDSFLLKSWRGSAHQADRAIRGSYWLRGNRNETADLRLADRAPAIWDEMLRLDAASDGRLLRWRAAALAAHRDRVAAVRAAPDFAELAAYCAQQDGGIDAAAAARWRARPSVIERSLEPAVRARPKLRLVG
jgi:hypothetical protein